MTKQKSNLTGLLLFYLFSFSELFSFASSLTGGSGTSSLDFFELPDEIDQIKNIRKRGFPVTQNNIRNNAVIIFKFNG